MCDQAIELQETSTDSVGPQARLMMDLEPTQSQAVETPQNLLFIISSTTEQFLTCRKYQRCGKSTCIHCQQIYSNKKTTEVTNNIKNKELIRIILTIKATPDDKLNNLVNDLYRHFRTLRRTAFWKANVAGGLARLHVDHTGESWHPHFDIIIEPTNQAESDLTELKLSTLWESITDDSHYVHIQPVTKTELSHIKLSTYILKPTFKGIADNETLMHEYSKAVKRKKKLQRFGSWTNTKNRKDWIR